MLDRKVDIPERRKLFAFNEDIASFPQGIARICDLDGPESNVTLHFLGQVALMLDVVANLEGELPLRLLVDFVRCVLNNQQALLDELGLLHQFARELICLVVWHMALLHYLRST